MRFFYQTRQWHLSNMWALCRPQIRIPLKYLIRYYKSFAMILSVLIFRSRCVTRLVLTVLRPWKCPRRNVRSCVREQSPRWRLSPVPGQRRAGAQYWLSTRNININTRTTSLYPGQWKVSAGCCISPAKLVGFIQISSLRTNSSMSRYHSRHQHLTELTR